MRTRTARLKLYDQRRSEDTSMKASPHHKGMGSVFGLRNTRNMATKRPKLLPSPNSRKNKRIKVSTETSLRPSIQQEPTLCVVKTDVSSSLDTGVEPTSQHKKPCDKYTDSGESMKVCETSIITSQSGNNESGMVAVSKTFKKNQSSDQVSIQTMDDIDVPTMTQRTLRLSKCRGGNLVMIGHGMYGYVIRGSFSDKDKTYDIVAKYFKPDLSTSDEILSEARIQHYLAECTDVVPRVHGLVKMSSGPQTDLPVLVQECFGNGLTLDSLVECSVPKKVWFNICLQAAEALHTIHRHHVLVNDVKPDNILIDYHLECPKVKFIDMGIATFRTSYVSQVREAEMKKCFHIAPEVRRQEPSSTKSDIYGLGFVFKTVWKYACVNEIQPLTSLMIKENPDNRPTLPTVIYWLNYLLNSHKPLGY